MVKFVEMVNGGEDVKVETCGVSGVRKHIRGVSKKGKKWRARVQHPKLKIRVSLGHYSTPEEAALAVKKKEAEFEQMSKEGCWDEFEERKLPSGVSRSGVRWLGVRIRHPKLGHRVSLGSCSTPEEAAAAVDKRREEFQKMYGHKTGTRRTSECLDEQTGVLELPVGVSKTKSGRWVASIRDPASNFSNWSGTYDTAEGAIASFNRRKTELAPKTTRAEFDGSEHWSEANEEPVKSDAEMLISGAYNLNSIPVSDKFNCVVVDAPDKFEEMVNGGEDVKVESCDGVSEVRKLIRGVSKKGKKWRARLQHPMLKTEVHLGHYSTPEEAALVVKKKRAEFEEMSKEGCWDDFKERKLLSGVKKSGLKRQGVRISHPKLKSRVLLGSHSTPEEAAVAADLKREEFQKMYGCRNVTGRMSECLDEQTGVLELPVGVSKMKSGRWVASIRDPASNFSIWLGTYDNAEGAIASFNRRRTELAAKTTRAEFDGSELWSEANAEPVAPDSEMIISGANNLNNIPVSDKLSCNVVDAPDSLEYDFLPSSLTSVFEQENSNRSDVPDLSVIIQENQLETACVPGFDEAVSLGIINEYGLFLGKFSEIDEQMELSLSGEDV